MVVSTTFEVLTDDNMIETLKKVKKSMSKNDLQETLKKLQGKQDPRSVETVFYEADIYDENKNKIGSADAETDNEDTWLNNLFGKK